MGIEETPCLDVYRGMNKRYSDYIKVFDYLYQLSTNDYDDIKELFESITQIAIRKYHFPAIQLLQAIQKACKFNDKYTRGYWGLFKMVFEEFQPRLKQGQFNYPFDALINQEYDMNWRLGKYSDLTIDQILEVHKEGTALYYIMNDDFDRFLDLVHQDQIKVNEYIEGKYLIEWSAYYGAELIFKFLRSNYEVALTRKCLEFAFLGRSVAILIECLRYFPPDYSCFIYALASHNLDSIIYILNNSTISVDSFDCSIYNNLGAFLIVIDMGRDKDKNLMMSSYFFVPTLTKSLIDLGADVNCRGMNYETPLHYAAGSNSYECAKVLLENGADITAKNEIGDTPLHFAASYNSKETAEIIIQYGGNCNAANDFGNTPLHNALMRQYIETASVLIENGADTNAKNEIGNTPLEYSNLELHVKEQKFVARKITISSDYD